jgi:hypothetical protein
VNVALSVDFIARSSGSLEHSPNGAVDAQIAALRQEYDQLRQETDLTEATDTVWCLARSAGDFEARVEALRQGGHRFTQSLANGACDLRDRWPNTEGDFDRELREVRYDLERSLDRVDNAMRDAERASDGGRIDSARTEIQSAARRLPEAQQRLARDTKASRARFPAIRRRSASATQDCIVRSSTKNAYGLEIVSYNATALPFSYAPGSVRRDYWRN